MATSISYTDMNQVFVGLLYSHLESFPKIRLGCTFNLFTSIQDINKDGFVVVLTIEIWDIADMTGTKLDNANKKIQSLILIY